MLWVLYNMFMLWKVVCILCLQYHICYDTFTFYAATTILYALRISSYSVSTIPYTISTVTYAISILPYAMSTMPYAMITVTNSTYAPNQVSTIPHMLWLGCTVYCDFCTLCCDHYLVYTIEYDCKGMGVFAPVQSQSFLHSPLHTHTALKWPGKYMYEYVYFLINF